MTIEERIDKTVRNVADFPKPGIQFKDISPIMEDAQLSKDIIAEFTAQWKGKIDAVAGVESRGFLFGFPLAMVLDIPFFLVRKKGKLPYKTVSYKYDLEYGSAEIEVHVGSIEPGMKVLVHDDLLATGGTADATAELIKLENGEVAGFSFLIELGFLNGTTRLEKHNAPIESIITY